MPGLKTSLTLGRLLELESEETLLRCENDARHRPIAFLLLGIAMGLTAFNVYMSRASSAAVFKLADLGAIAPLVWRQRSDSGPARATRQLGRLRHFMQLAAPGAGHGFDDAASPSAAAAGNASLQLQEQGMTTPQLHRVTFRGCTFLVPHGTLLRTALLRNKLTPHNEKACYINCRGIGSCGTCAVQVEGGVEPAERGGIEDARLSFPPFTKEQHTHLRLSCQVCVVGDCSITKFDKFWGQGVKVVDRSPYAVPVGAAEFVLDRKSPPHICGSCVGTRAVGCPNCDGRGRYMAMGGAVIVCRACRGSGQVICRTCFEGDPYDIEAIREIAKNRPD